MSHFDFRGAHFALLKNSISFHFFTTGIALRAGIALWIDQLLHMVAILLKPLLLALQDILAAFLCTCSVGPGPLALLHIS
jgi:hypothetical protein